MKKQELDDFIPSCGSQFLLNIQRRTSHVVFKAETSIVQRFTTGISGPWITDSIPSDESSSTHQLKGMSRQTVHQQPAASTCLSLTERREQLNRCNQPTFICRLHQVRLVHLQPKTCGRTQCSTSHHIINKL